MSNLSHTPAVAVLGSTNWDICMYLPHLPTPGETVGGGRLQTNLGGKGANQAVASHKAGVATTFISTIGDDSTGDTVIEQFTQLGLNTQAVSRIANTATGTACIFIDAKAENCIGITPGANAALSATIIDQHEDTIAQSSALLMQLETPLTSVQYAAEMCARHNTKLVLNPAPAAHLPDTLLSLIHVITPNQGELALLTGLPVNTQEDVEVAARSLLEKGIAHVVVTLGANGALLVNHDGTKHFPAKKVDAVDTTAAGDIFNGYLTANLAKHWDFDQAIPVAIAAASLSVTRKGAIPSIPSADELA